VIPIEQKKRWLKFFLIALVILIIAVGAWAGSTITHAHTPVLIGVLLPVTGNVDIKEPLEWAKDTVNQQGGIGGRQIELVYMDTGTGNTTQMAEELLANDSIQIVIGPRTSDEVYALAPEFIKKKKLLISPSATAGSITLAFGNQGYFWRTTQSDAAQVHVIMNIITKKGAHRVALLAARTTYGETFYDWSGFFAIEDGLDLVSIQQFDPASSMLNADVANALKSDPDYIIAACDNPSDAATIKRAIDRSGKPAKLFLTDGATSPALISSLGSAAEGIEGTSPTADPSTGFSDSYEVKTGHAPNDFAATTYDALLLAAYTSARQDAVPSESLAASIRNVVSGNGTSPGWDAQAVHGNLVAIESRQTPRISGASGPLIFDKEVGVDPLTTYYSHWLIKDGDFQTIGVFSANASANGVSIARSRPTIPPPTPPSNSGISSVPQSAGKTDLLLANVSPNGESVARNQSPSPPSNSGMSPVIPVMGKNIPLLAKTDFEAVIIAPTNGWNNYRHQADGLTLYTLLRDNGVPDDHIILMLYDDIPTLKENPIQGNVHHVPEGPNIRFGANVSYSGSQVTAATLKNVLTGTKTDSTPVVLDSNASTDVFIYIVGHGDPGTIDFWNNNLFTTDDFTSVTDTMSREQKYRQLVFLDDTCFGRSIATNAAAPGIIYLTGASSTEPSFAATYDIDIKQWISDEFTSETVNLIEENPNITFRELYTEAYTNVTGSHVQIIATGNVSTLNEPVLEFLKM
jgi:ABC-type branched-subunit amino acid transport system substrate-binding protein